MENMDRKTGVAVLAGTPVDTQMGVEVLRAAEFHAVAYPVAENPRMQTAFQILQAQEKQDAVRKVLKQAMHDGCRQAFVYCNSLSAAVDFPTLSQELGLPIVTPLDVYRQLAKQYRSLGVIAANAQGLAGIERVMLQVNPNLDLYEASALAVVLSVEAGETPEKLIQAHSLKELTQWFQNCGVQALVLGCTHFPYYKDALASQTSLRLLDPAEGMLALLRTYQTQ